MYICLCYGISDSKIEKMIREGASTLKEIQQKTNAGANCGSCICDLQKLLTKDKESRRPATAAEIPEVRGAKR